MVLDVSEILLKAEQWHSKPFMMEGDPQKKNNVLKGQMLRVMKRFSI